jgi:hypothetical protein
MMAKVWAPTSRVLSWSGLPVPRSVSLAFRNFGLDWPLCRLTSVLSFRLCSPPMISQPPPLFLSELGTSCYFLLPIASSWKPFQICSKLERAGQGTPMCLTTYFTLTFYSICFITLTIFQSIHLWSILFGGYCSQSVVDITALHPQTFQHTWALAIFVHGFFVCVYGSSWIWTQGLMVARQVLCHLSHSSNPVLFWLFLRWGLLIAASQVVRITGVSHLHPAC